MLNLETVFIPAFSDFMCMWLQSYIEVDGTKVDLEWYVEEFSGDRRVSILANSPASFLEAIYLMFSGDWSFF